LRESPLSTPARASKAVRESVSARTARIDSAHHPSLWLKARNATVESTDAFGVAHDVETQWGNATDEVATRGSWNGVSTGHATPVDTTLLAEWGVYWDAAVASVPLWGVSQRLTAASQMEQNDVR
jgi:hypothetical protein